MEYSLFYSKFDVEGEPATIGSRWEHYMKGFELFADARGLIIEEDKDANKQQRLALLLHSAGAEVQKIFDTFPTTIVSNKKGYTEAVNQLNEYFIPKVNVPFQRNVFREMEQNSNETVRQFATRLRQGECRHSQTRSGARRLRPAAWPWPLA